VDGFRRTGNQDHLPRSLFSRAWLKTVDGDPEAARADPVWKIAERGPMRLSLAAFHPYRARAFHTVKP
jgi:hypothetical protein